MPRQLLLGSSFGLVQESMRKKPAWLEPFRRALQLTASASSPASIGGKGFPT
jgi:hypothetical protein